MNPSSVIQNGHKTRLASKLEDVVFPLTHLCEIEPVSSRTLLEQFKKAHRFFCLFVCFSWDGQQRSWPCIHICMRCRSNHKIVVKNHTKLTTAIGLYMNSFTRERTERTRTCLKLALAVTMQPRRPWIPYACISVKRRSCGTKSKAFERSKNTTSVVKPLSLTLAQSWNEDNNWEKQYFSQVSGSQILLRNKDLVCNQKKN